LKAQPGGKALLEAHAEPVIDGVAGALIACLNVAVEELGIGAQRVEQSPADEAPIRVADSDGIIGFARGGEVGAAAHQVDHAIGFPRVEAVAAREQVRPLCAVIADIDREIAPRKELRAELPLLYVGNRARLRDIEKVE